MNVKRFLIAVVLVFAAFQIMDIFVHGFLLMKSYEALAQVWRPNLMSLTWIMYGTGLVFAILFVYIFIKGYEGTGILEGVRFGIVAGLFVNVAGALNQYVIYPLPFVLVVQWLVYGTIECVIAGAIAAAAYREREA
jgi:hypothetical protein